MNLISARTTCFRVLQQNVATVLTLVMAAFGLMLATPHAGATVSVETVEQVVSSQPVSATQPAGFARAVIITIKDEITDITHDSLERRLDIVRQEDYPLVIFELNTPGGALGATLEICDAIKALNSDGIQTYAWIHNKAYSAGTIIALAANGVTMSRNATMGDCQPIMITGTGASAVPEDIEAKLTSPLLAELRDSARRGGYNLDMVYALVRPEMQMFWLVNQMTGEKRFVDTQGRDELFGLPSDDIEVTAAEDEDDKKSKRKTRVRRTEPVSDSTSKTDWRYVTDTPLLGQVSQPVVSDRELLTMKTVEASAYGFSQATLNDEAELRQYFHIAGTVDRMENTWLESAVEWLASPMVRGILFLLMMLGAYAEFQAPGFGFPGAVALVALILFLGAPYLAGFTVTWEIVAIVLGIALLAVEAFVIPGFGVAGISGIMLLIIGLLASFVPQEPGFGEDWFRMPSLPLTYRYLQKGLYSLAGGMTGSIICMILLAKYFPKLPVGSRLIPANPTPEQVVIDDPYDGLAQVGDMGCAESLLRPSGKARFGAILVDVVSEGEYIPKGTRVEVVERRGNRVVVRRTQ